MLSKTLKISLLKLKQSFLVRFSFSFVVLLFVYVFLYGTTIPFISSANQDRRSLLRTLNQVNEYIQQYYVEADTLDQKKLFDGAMRGMVEALGDRFSRFLSPSELKELQSEDIKGDFVGIGVEISYFRYNGYPIIAYLINSGPAFKTNVQPNDIIIEVSGESTLDMSIEKLKKKLRGKIGDGVNIKVKRLGYPDTISINIVRQNVEKHSVSHGFIKPGLGYIVISAFYKRTYKELKEAIQFLNKNKLNQLIIDLRNNPGGVLASVVKCVNFFLDEGKIVYTKGNYKEQNATFYANKATTLVDFNIPIVVLVNKMSASASEIFAAALQDTQRAWILGTETYGKSAVQSILVFPYLDSKAGLRLTTQYYFTPKGKMVSKKGVSPDKLIKIQPSKHNKLNKLNDMQEIVHFLNTRNSYTNNDLIALQSRLKKQKVIMDINRLKQILASISNVKKTRVRPLYSMQDSQLVDAINWLKLNPTVKRDVKVFK